MTEASIFGQRLLLARRARGLTQQQLGEQAGISWATIARIEQGRASQMGTDALRGIAEVLGVSTDYLLGLVDTPRLAQGDAGPLERGEQQTEVAPVMSESFARAPLMTGNDTHEGASLCVL
jgi:transcriptional regulator with XRE-family HTH domain